MMGVGRSNQPAHHSSPPAKSSRGSVFAAIAVNLDGPGSVPKGVSSFAETIQAAFGADCPKQDCLPRRGLAPNSAKTAFWGARSFQQTPPDIFGCDFLVETLRNPPPTR